ncbi:MAG TPA: class I SAM-dependent methyltransferase [Solirubrobacteraceae bacterium]|nr:class I SAM-dependent methyltransferase [Solirubrobacteraceae bacterium]
MSSAKFDPTRAHCLNAPERERFLPDARILELLQLSGSETVLDYGAGTGRLTVPIAAALPAGRVIALDEHPEMIAHLRRATAGLENVEVIEIAHNAVPLPERSVDRVLAANILHEVRGQRALAEIARLLAPAGTLLVVDWERGRKRDLGPPEAHLYTLNEALAELAAVGLHAEAIPAQDLPYHFALRARIG